jgi:hypothetical protein
MRVGEIHQVNPTAESIVSLRTGTGGAAQID